MTNSINSCGSRAHAQLVHQPVNAAVLDGADAQVQLGGHQAIGLAGDDQAQHLFFGAVQRGQVPLDFRGLLSLRCSHIQKAIKLAVVKWEHRQQRAEVERHLSSLSRAEKQVLGLIVAGKTNRLMAAELDLSVRTIEDRRARLMHKLGVRSARRSSIELVTANGLASDGEGAKTPPG